MQSHATGDGPIRKKTLFKRVCADLTGSEAHAVPSTVVIAASLPWDTATGPFVCGTYRVELVCSHSVPRDSFVLFDAVSSYAVYIHRFDCARYITVGGKMGRSPNWEGFARKQSLKVLIAAFVYNNKKRQDLSQNSCLLAENQTMDIPNMKQEC